MTETLTLPGDRFLAFDHLAGYGLMAICAAGGEDPRLRWSPDLESRLLLDGVPGARAAELVHEHATRHCEPESWVQQDGINNGEPRGLFSPRVKVMEAPEIRNWYADRNRTLDRIGSDPWSRLDLGLIGARGEPSYWSHDRGSPRPDNGASPWEMTTRNQGKEFVTSQLRQLAAHVASRNVADVECGLRGQTLTDEKGNGRPDSRTPTGLMSPRLTDNARAWCALWGLSVLTVVPSTAGRGVSHASGHTGPRSSGAFHLPVMTVPWELPRLRSVLASAHLEQACASASQDVSLAHRATTTLAWSWLRSRGVAVVMQFPVYRSSNPNAPERWAERGTTVKPDDL